MLPPRSLIVLHGVSLLKISNISNINPLDKDELRAFMSSSEIDILSVNETKLNFSVDNNEIHLQGFDIVGKDRLTNGRNGGACLYDTKGPT